MRREFNDFEIAVGALVAFLGFWGSLFRNFWEVFYELRF